MAIPSFLVFVLDTNVAACRVPEFTTKEFFLEAVSKLWFVSELRAFDDTNERQ
jgi:hypothetical protein